MNKTEKPIPNCCICGNLVEEKTHEGKVYWNQGECALPVKDGRCCSKCNWGVVVPARWREVEQRLLTAVNKLGDTDANTI